MIIQTVWSSLGSKMSPATLKGNYVNFYFDHWTHFNARHSREFYNCNLKINFCLQSRHY